MVVIWTERSKVDLRNFLHNIREGTSKSATHYISNLTKYVDSLEDNPFLGKPYSKLISINLRQLVYRKHKILYTISGNQIFILSVLHTSRDSDTFFQNFSA